MNNKRKKSGGGKRKKMRNKNKIGFIDRMLEKLPEMHIRGYNYCGPNTNLMIRIARGDSPVNKLDGACLEHDIAYAECEDLEMRCIADKVLALKAIKRIFARDSAFGERFSALIVSWLISTKIILSKTELFIFMIRKCLTAMLKLKRRQKEEIDL